MKRNKKKIAQFNHLSKKQLPSPQDELRSIEKSKFKWRIVKEYLDFNHGSFGWKNLYSSEILQVIIPKLLLMKISMYLIMCLQAMKMPS